MKLPNWLKPWHKRDLHLEITDVVMQYEKLIVLATFGKKNIAIEFPEKCVFDTQMLLDRIKGKHFRFVERLVVF